MTACSSKLQALLYVTEGAGADADWAEVSTDMSSAVRLPHTEIVTFDGLEQQMLDPARVTQYLNERSKGIPGPQGGSFKFSVYLCGYGATTAGATSSSVLGALLGWFLGGNTVTAANGTTDAGGGTSTTTNIVTAASGTFAQGGFFKLGAKQDAHGDGQLNIVESHTLTALVPEFALPAAPANGDVVYSADNAYLLESSCAVVPKRFAILTADVQIVAHGCYPMAIGISGLSPGEIPMATFTVGVSAFEPVSQTFPTAIAVTTHTPAPTGGGSICFQDNGTRTRNALTTLRQFSLDVALGIKPIPGHGNYTAQKWAGAKRQPTKVTAKCIVDAAGPSSAPTYWADWAANAAKHLLVTLSTGIGSSVGICLPLCYFTGQRPTMVAVDDLNRVSFEVVASTDTNESASELARSAFKVGLL